MTAGGALLGRGDARRAAEAMRRLRHARGLTQADLGDMLGRDQGWVSLRERSCVRMRRATAEKVAAALGTDLAALTGDAP